MPSFVAPSYESKKFTCPRCGAIAQQDRKQLVSWSSNVGWDNQAYTDNVSDMSQAGEVVVNEDGDSRSEGKLWAATHCAACEDHSLWIGGNLVFPSVTDAAGVGIPAPAEDMPDNVRALYIEAAAVYPYSRRAAAALCRAALERLVKLLTPDLSAKARLDDRVAALSKNMNPSLTKMLHVIRHVGNSALHGTTTEDEAVIDLRDDSKNDITDLFFASLNALVLERISFARRADALYSNLPEGVLKTIEAKMEGGETIPAS